jgi:hypothetical protein
MRLLPPAWRRRRLLRRARDCVGRGGLVLGRVVGVPRSYAALLGVAAGPAWWRRGGAAVALSPACLAVAGWISAVSRGHCSRVALLVVRRPGPLGGRGGMFPLCWWWSRCRRQCAATLVVNKSSRRRGFCSSGPSPMRICSLSVFGL